MKGIPHVSGAYLHKSVSYEMLDSLSVLMGRREIGTMKVVRALALVLDLAGCGGPGGPQAGEARSGSYNVTQGILGCSAPALCVVSLETEGTAYISSDAEYTATTWEIVDGSVWLPSYSVVYLGEEWSVDLESCLQRTATW